MKLLIPAVAISVLLAGCGVPALVAPAGATVIVSSTPAPTAVLVPPTAAATAAPPTAAATAVPTTLPTTAPTLMPPVVAPTPAPAAGSGVVAVDIIGFVYEPNPVVVRVGTTVIWTNRDTTVHTATAEDASFESGLLTLDATFRFTFIQPTG